MQLELRNSAKRWVAATVILSLAASYVTLSVTRYFAAHFSDDPDPARLRRATWLDPGNAEYKYRLGRYELLARQSPQSALPWLNSATAMNPRSARYWIDLAIAQQSLGDTDSEKQSLQHALDVDPRTPEIAWQAANLYLAQGSPENAMQEFHTVLENAPPLTSLAIHTCWKIRPDIDYLLDHVVPPNVYVSFLGFLISKNETEAAEKVWERLFSLQQAVERQDLFAYLRYLIAHQQVSQAALVWQQAANLSGLAAYQPSSANLLVNGDFSLEILNGGFDWLHQTTPGVGLALDPSETHSGSRSLRITLDGPGIGDVGIRQLVPVEPNTHYEFSAFYKAQEMDGAGGLEFAIQDLYRETPFFMSDNLGEADFWKKAGGSFTTGPDTHAIVLRIARVPAGSPIRGKLWIDGLQLVGTDDVTLAREKEPQ
jgi:tetratricopeptide (TPR) repeat protein